MVILNSYQDKDKSVHTFQKGTCPKVKIVAWLEFELAKLDHKSIEED